MATFAGRALLDTFARIRIISLPERLDRRRQMSAELGRLGIDIDGQRVAFHDACRPMDRGEFPTIGARGCFISHLTVLEQAEAAGVCNVLILEDDLDFTRDVEQRLPQTLHDLTSQPWSIFYGGHEQYSGHLKGGLLSPADPECSVLTTHFVAFSKAAIAAAVPYLNQMLEREDGDPRGGPMHVDGAYSWLRQAHPELGTWLATPALGRQRPSRTDVHKLKLLDRTPVLRNMMAAGRGAKRVLLAR